MPHARPALPHRLPGLPTVRLLRPHHRVLVHDAACHINSTPDPPTLGSLTHRRDGWLSRHKPWPRARVLRHAPIMGSVRVCQDGSREAVLRRGARHRAHHGPCYRCDARGATRSWCLPSAPAAVSTPPAWLVSPRCDGGATAARECCCRLSHTC
jgi:hypothetical protein